MLSLKSFFFSERKKPEAQCHPKPKICRKKKSRNISNNVLFKGKRGTKYLEEKRRKRFEFLDKTNEAEYQ